ncbi:MAG: tRNA (N6-threonylcarbamoyladenosine(37)-N6)-methyltransferase TrmO [Thermodesulfovibrionales bacterium]|nr:tRNA (N6-threonylcarbamoyladenosine(37)-N6)-methyltransferase TrmO [Thermodesulfovibrionales bacterium]
MRNIEYKPIGIIRSPFKDIKNMPIQPSGAKSVRGTVEIEPEYAVGLKDLDGFSHIILIYHFHLSKGCSLEVKPFLDDDTHGVFSTRAPKRPNPIGVSTVKLNRIEGCILHIEDVDIVDGTPLLDIKPYVPEFDIRKVERIGWLFKKVNRVEEVKSDERFG